MCCSVPIEYPYSYAMHHIFHNGNEHNKSVAAERKSKSLTDRADTGQGAGGSRLRRYLVRMHFKDDKKYPITILCHDCHIFEQNNNRLRTPKEIHDYHSKMAYIHHEAIGYNTYNHITNNFETESQSKIHDFLR